ncbi:hypothetical protein DFJ74DRAFT_708061 [Hyaloraphidium curvatum]|nr:hypothetical protein DFJ74DRAFT_708061 [Hyaloraphidium curvatum]
MAPRGSSGRRRCGIPLAAAAGALLLLLAAPLGSHAVDAATKHRRTTQPPFWYYKCLPIYNFLTNLGAEGVLWSEQAGNSTGCCGYDESTLTATRRITCTEDLQLQSLTWTGDSLRGNLEDSPITADFLSDNFTSIDLSDNPGLSGPFPRWMMDLRTLQSVVLSGTNISGQLPRLDRGWLNLTTLTLSDTEITGYLPALPSTLQECSFPTQQMCYYPTASWTPSTPLQCLSNLVACSGNPPVDKEPPPLPPVLSPHMEEVDEPYVGFKTPAEQCKLLKQWLVFHGEDEKGLWNDTAGCCPFWRDGILPNREVSCLAWGITFLAWKADPPLKGDINLPANTLSELKGLRNVGFPNQRLSGGFPVWATQINDLFGINLENNSLSGPVLSMLQNGYFNGINLAGNNFSGPIPQMQVRDSIYGNSASGYGFCRLSPENNNLCWEFDTAFYDSHCVESNPNIPVCGDNSTTTPPEPPPTGPTNYTCIRSCADQRHYINVRLLSQPNGRIQCSGPNVTACSWYTDSNCTRLAPNEPAPVTDQGMICGQAEAGWCAVAASVLLAGEPPVTECGALGPWKCVRSCTEPGYVKARTVGELVEGGTVQCQGPNAEECSWYSNSACTVLAPGQVMPEASGEEGYVCDQLSTGWCEEAALAVFANETITTCPTASATASATASRTPTETASGTASQTAGTTTLSRTATATPTSVFPEPPPRPPLLPDGARAADLPKGSEVRLSSDSAGSISCSGSVCTMNPSARGTFRVDCPSGRAPMCNVMDLMSITEPGKCLAVDAGTRNVAASYLPFWTIYNQSSTAGSQNTKVINSNLEVRDGCLLLPTSTGSAPGNVVRVGPCEDAQASAWSVTANGLATPTPTPLPPPSSSANIGAIVGGVIGGIAAVGLIGGGGYYLYRRNQSPAAQAAKGGHGDTELQSLTAKPADFNSPATPNVTNGAVGYQAINGKSAAVAPSAPPYPGAIDTGSFAATAAAATVPSTPVSSSIPQSKEPLLAALVDKNAVAIQPYKRQHEDELSLAVGDKVLILTSHDDGWGRVRRMVSDPGMEEEGMVPLSFLSLQ